MESKYSELFSSLGYDALDVILGINPHLIPEAEVRKLIHLIGLSEESDYLELEIKKIKETYCDNPEMKLKLLLHLVEHHI